VPRGPYADLSTWAKIPFLYTAETRRMVSDMARLAVDGPAMARFVRVLEDELGHEIAFAVERAKIGANGDGGQGRIDLGIVEKGLARALETNEMNRDLASNRAALGLAARDTLDMAGVTPDSIARVILVGGSSLMGFVSDEMQTLCPKATLLRSEAFTAVVDGLALATTA
jgi:hypothetical chaperone protein